MRRSWFVLVLLGCGLSVPAPITRSSSINVNGSWLVPQSSLMFEHHADGFPFGDAVEILMTEVPDYCVGLRAAIPEPGCNPSSPSPKPPLITGPTLQLSLPPEPKAGTTIGVDEMAWFVFKWFAPDGGARGEDARGGTIEIVEFTPKRSISGRYVVVFLDGARKSGDFAATYCDAMDLANATASVTRQCYSTVDPGVCERGCHCGRLSALAQCAQPDGGAWGCTCWSWPDGGTSMSTTCTMPAAPDCDSDKGTCCDLTL